MILKWIQDLESDMQKRDISNLSDKPGVDTEYVVFWCKTLKLDTFNLI